MAMKHSVVLDSRRCRGCTSCIKGCPTEAIRVRGRKATILPDRCIDCGECIRICPHKAIKSVGDSLDVLSQYEYCVALPEPALYGQFHNLDNIDIVLNALLKIGFHKVYEVAKAAEMLSDFERQCICEGPASVTPLISSSCPTVLRLIRMRFPKLMGHVACTILPMELAAILARREAAEETGLPPERIGVFGDSAGGYVAQMVGTTNGETRFDQGDHIEQSSAVQAVATIYGISDLTNIGEGYSEEIQRIHAAPNVTEALLVHGTAFHTYPGAGISLADYRKETDLLIYYANMKVSSNQTTIRIAWDDFLGEDSPKYVCDIPTLFLSFSNPYHLTDVPMVRTYINAYTSNEATVRAVVEKLMGRSEFKGKSPVDPFCGLWDTKR